MHKLVLAFSIVLVTSGCHSSAAGVDGGAAGSGDGNGSNGGVGGGAGNGGAGGGGSNGGSRWVDVRPDEYFVGIGAVGAELWGLGGVRGTSVTHIDHRAADGTWTDTAYTLPAPVLLQRFLPLAADNLYALADDEQSVYHWSGSAWSVLHPADGHSFAFFAGTGSTAYLGSFLNAKTWGTVWVSTNGAPFAPAIPGGECRSFDGGFAGNGVAVFSDAVFDCSTSSEIGQELWLSTGSDLQPYDNKYDSDSWWAASPTDIYVGVTAGVVHLHGHVWTKEDLPLDDPYDYVVALAGTSVQDVWALTAAGFVCHSTGGGNWSCEEPRPMMPGDGGRSGIALALTGPGDAWALLAGDRLYHRQ